MPLRQLGHEPGQDRKVAAISVPTVCNGFIICYERFIYKKSTQFSL